MSRQFLVDTMMFEQRSLPGLRLESVTKSGIMRVSGILQKANTKNHNGRIYPMKVLKEQVDKYKYLVKERAAYGELDHPENSVVELKNASHIITEIGFDGDDVIGVCEILDNQPAGRCLKGFFERKTKVGISSRGVGSVQEIDESTVEVQPDFEIVCWDFVSNPSTPGAYMNLTESNNIVLGDLIKENKIWKYQKANKLVTDIFCEIGGRCEC